MHVVTAAVAMRHSVAAAERMLMSTAASGRSIWIDPILIASAALQYLSRRQCFKTHRLRARGAPSKI
jgi:hypothetical protein